MGLFSQHILYFAIYSLIGWAVESTFCSIKFRKLTNRGFLNGPLCPVYAAGALAIVLVMQWMPHTGPVAAVLIVFLTGLVITSAIEYFTGWLLEMLFKTTWWDYSDSRFNIKGRVCLPNSLAFGALCVALIFVIHPAVILLVSLLPGRLAKWLAAVFVVALTADLTVTVFTIQNLNARLKNIQAGMTAIREKLDSFQWHPAAGIKERIAQLYENRDTENQLFKSIEFIYSRIHQLEFDNRALQKRLLHAFPNLKSKRYPEYLNNIKEHVGVLIRKKPEAPQQAHKKDETV